MIEGAAKCVNVTANVSVQPIAAILFQRGVKGGAAPLNNGDGHLIRDKRFDETEIHQFEHAIRGDL